MYTRYYRLLGLEPNAGSEEIKRAYRRLAKVYHPDLNLPTSDRNKFIELTQAYERLIDRKKRPRFAKYVNTKKSYKAKRKKKTRGTRHPRDNANRYSRMRYKTYKKESDAFVDKAHFWKYRIYLYCGMFFVYSMYAVVACSIIFGFMDSTLYNPLLWFLSMGLLIFWRKTHHMFLVWKKDYSNVFVDQ